MTGRYEVIDNNFTVFLKDHENNKNIVDIYRLTEILNNYDTEKQEHEKLIKLLTNFIVSEGYSVSDFNNYLIDTWKNEKTFEETDTDTYDVRYMIDENGILDLKTNTVYYTDDFNDVLNLIEVMNKYYTDNIFLDKDNNKLRKENYNLTEENKRLLSYLKEIVYKIERNDYHSNICVDIARRDYPKFEELINKKQEELW